MPIVTEQDLNEVQKKEQLPAKPTVAGKVKAEIQKSQVNNLVLVAAVATLSQYANIDLAHLLAAYLIVRGLPAIAVNLSTKAR